MTEENLNALDAAFRSQTLEDILDEKLSGGLGDPQPTYKIPINEFEFPE